MKMKKRVFHLYYVTSSTTTLCHFVTDFSKRKACFTLIIPIQSIKKCEVNVNHLRFFLLVPLDPLFWFPSPSGSTTRAPIHWFRDGRFFVQRSHFLLGLAGNLPTNGRTFGRFNQHLLVLFCLQQILVFMCTHHQRNLSSILLSVPQYMHLVYVVESESL